jgi:hypothetical protein
MVISFKTNVAGTVTNLTLFADGVEIFTKGFAILRKSLLLLSFRGHLSTTLFVLKYLFLEVPECK